MIKLNNFVMPTDKIRLIASSKIIDRATLPEADNHMCRLNTNSYLAVVCEVSGIPTSAETANMKYLFPYLYPNLTRIIFVHLLQNS